MTLQAWKNQKTVRRAATKGIAMIAVLLIAIGMSAAHASEQSEVLWTNNNLNTVHNNAEEYYVMLDIEKKCVVTSIMTYHYFNEGALPGTITLYAQSGEQWGPFQAVGVEGQGGVQNAYWIADVGEIHLSPGRYAIEDSDPSTWSNNALSDYKGIAELRGYVATGNPFGTNETGAAVSTDDNTIEETTVVTDANNNDAAIDTSAKAYAATVISFTAGEPWTSDSKANDPASVLGMPDYDSESDTNYLTLGSYGTITLQLDRYIVDGDGVDLYVYEIGSGVEETKVEVSNDLVTWYYVGESDGYESGVDMNGKVPEGTVFNYVRITDRDGGSSEWPGADIDAVEGVHALFINPGTEANTGSGEQSLLEKAQAGDPEAQNELGDIYYFGTDVQQDYAQAAMWYRKAAEQRYAVAQNNLGYMYDFGLGVPQDDEQAVAWYRKAAEQGDAAAQNNLGAMYYDGLGVPQDYEQAVAWYRKAVEQGLAMAQYHLGLMYENGNGVEKDIDHAIVLYSLAAEQGYEEAADALKRLQ